MQDAQDEPLFVQRAAGLDVAKAGVDVTIRVPSDTSPGRRQQETRAFGTTRRGLDSLADWLRSWGVTTAGMEATGDYWKPVFFLLESRGLDCELYNSAQVKALAGRPKTDRADSIWIAKITERGMIASSFVPARADPPAAHPYPLPPASHPGPDRREAAGGKAAGRRAPEAVQRDL
jgi:transposase